MRAIWNGTLSTGRSELLTVPGLAWPVAIRPHPQAKGLRLRVDESRGVLTLTCPRRFNRRRILDWVQGQSDWVDSQLARVGQAEPFRPGQAIPFLGRDMLLVWSAELGRTPVIADNCLSCGGPIENFPKRIERFLRDRARTRLSEETAAAAARTGVAVKSVSVGDTSSRWGSCSASGAIRYNWRLILAPPHLLRWVVAHEVAHRVHMDHGPRFKALEAELYGGNVSAARAELRALGPRLKRVGRLL